MVVNSSLRFFSDSSPILDNTTIQLVVIVGGASVNLILNLNPSVISVEVVGSVPIKGS